MFCIVNGPRELNLDHAKTQLNLLLVCRRVGQWRPRRPSLVTNLHTQDFHPAPASRKALRRPPLPPTLVLRLSRRPGRRHRRLLRATTCPPYRRTTSMATTRRRTRTRERTKNMVRQTHQYTVVQFSNSSKQYRPTVPIYTRTVRTTYCTLYYWPVNTNAKFLHKKNS